MFKFKKNFLLLLICLFIIIPYFPAYSDELNAQLINIDPLPAGTDEIVQNILNSIPTDESAVIRPIDDYSTVENDTAIIEQKNYKFANGDFYWMRRYTFKKTEKDNFYTSTFTIPGNTISVRYANYDVTPKSWVIKNDDVAKLGKATLFIDTDKYSIILSVPAVYKNNFAFSTIESVPEKENPVTITKDADLYKISFKFPVDSNLIGEIWALQSFNKLVDFSKETTNESYFLTHDLHKERRWSWDGYYFKTYTSYVPYTPNTYFRQPANYTGASFAKIANCNATFDLGYIMMKTMAMNQNPYGFWETGSKSNWLNEDFNIPEGFYDTRFNTDFARGLIAAYHTYKNKDFLSYALKYSQFFINYALKNKYTTLVDEEGYLIPDYSSPTPHIKTHTSLNHQLAEMNFLYELYLATGDEGYLDFANKMLQGIKNIYTEFILPDNNLKYAVFYNGKSKLVDYPALTYNDLFETQALLMKIYNSPDDTLSYLMDCKLKWMNANNVTDYFKPKVVETPVP